MWCRKAQSGFPSLCLQACSLNWKELVLQLLVSQLSMVRSVKVTLPSASIRITVLVLNRQGNEIKHCYDKNGLKLEIKEDWHIEPWTNTLFLRTPASLGLSPCQGECLFMCFCGLPLLLWIIEVAQQKLNCGYINQKITNFLLFLYFSGQILKFQSKIIPINNFRKKTGFVCPVPSINFAMLSCEMEARLIISDASKEVKQIFYSIQFFIIKGS